MERLERQKIRITGGENCRVTQFGRDYVVNAMPAGDSAGTATAESCEFGFVKYDVVPPPTGTTDPTQFKIGATGGTLNGLLPQNFNNIGDFDSDTTAYVTLDATADSSGVTTLQYTKLDAIPDIKPQYGIGAPPSEIRFFAFMVVGGNITGSLCRNIFINPEVAYLDESTSTPRNICTWSITNSA